jgi:dihydrofolate reductase
MLGSDPKNALFGVRPQGFGRRGGRVVEFVIVPTSGSTVTIHMVSSLDGFIEKPDKSVAWLETSGTYEQGVGFDTAADIIASIDCYVMGARTYELALTLGWPYGDVPVVVLTHRDLPNDRNTVEFYAGDLHGLVHDRLKPAYRDIWLVGGAELVKDFIRQGLADAIRLTIAPTILGEGLPFFDHVGVEQALRLKDVTAYENGMVELWYELRKD